MERKIERYCVPGTVEEAVEAIAGKDATLFAGGTDLMVQTRSGKRPFTPLLVNISRIAGLGGISTDGDRVRLGALATISGIRTSALLKEKAGVLTEAADSFAGDQVRNKATVGGNICNASPAGDMIVPLLLLDAEVELASTAGRRMLPLCNFFTGPGKTRRERNELLTAIYFPIPPVGFAAGFRKFGTRPAMDISIVSVGVAATRDGAGWKNVRAAFGAVAPTPIRGTRTEAAIEKGGTAGEIARIAESEVSPISDVRASAWYRKELIRTLTERLHHDVFET